MGYVQRWMTLFALSACMSFSLAIAFGGATQKNFQLAQAPEERARRIIRVGREHSIKTVADAARLAHDNDVVEIEADEYRGAAALAVWTQDNLVIRGVHGRPKMVAGERVAEGKGIWIVRGGNIVIENITFSGARAAEHNGAGIRLVRGKLTVRRCAFFDNENGMLVANDSTVVVEIEDSEFADNGARDGYSHNLYVGSIRRLTVQGSYFHHARLGHLLKTRAAENFIEYNRLTGEAGGRSSYELEFPWGGMAVVLGNLIQQGPQTENSVIVSFGAEGYKWPRNELYVSHNTLVNDRPGGGIFIKAYPGLAYTKAVNNIFVGNGELDIKTKAEIEKNWDVDRGEFMDPLKFDFRLNSSSRVKAAANELSETDTFLRPEREYTYPVGTKPISGPGGQDPGAFQ